MCYPLVSRYDEIDIDLVCVGLMSTYSKNGKMRVVVTEYDGYQRSVLRYRAYRANFTASYGLNI